MREVACWSVLHQLMRPQRRAANIASITLRILIIRECSADFNILAPASNHHLKGTACLLQRPVAPSHTSTTSLPRLLALQVSAKHHPDSPRDQTTDSRYRLQDRSCRCRGSARLLASHLLQIETGSEEKLRSRSRKRKIGVIGSSRTGSVWNKRHHINRNRVRQCTCISR